MALRNTLKTVLGTAGWGIPPGWLARLSAQPLILPFYHTVSDAPLPMTRGMYRVRTVKQFTHDLDFLRRHFRPLGMETLIEHIRTGSAPRQPSFLLSFDDGLSGNHEVVAPILEAKGIPAAFFINTDFVDNKDLFYRYKAGLILERLEHARYAPAITEQIMRRYRLPGPGRRTITRFIRGVPYRERHLLDDLASLLDLDFQAFLKVKQPYMSKAQIRDLQARGFHIGSHSRDHPLFSDLSLQEQLQQYRYSMDQLGQVVPGHSNIFSFPFTDDEVPEAFFLALHNAGDPPQASFGTAGLKKESVPWHFQRISMEIAQAGAGCIIRGEYLYYLFKAPAGRNKIKRR